MFFFLHYVYGCNCGFIPNELPYILRKYYIFEQFGGFDYILDQKSITFCPRSPNEKGDLLLKSIIHYIHTQINNPGCNVTIGIELNSLACSPTSM